MTLHNVLTIFQLFEMRVEGREGSGKERQKEKGSNKHGWHVRRMGWVGSFH